MSRNRKTLKAKPINYKSSYTYHTNQRKLLTMRFSYALISFLPSLSSMAMEETHDSVPHDIMTSILEESLDVNHRKKKKQENMYSPFSQFKANKTYKKLMSHLEPLKIRNNKDGSHSKANGAELADNIKGDIMQKKEPIHHLGEHQQSQEGKSLELCHISPTTTTTATSDDDSLMKRKIFSNEESIITKMDSGLLNRGTCSSPKDICVPKNKAIEGNGLSLKSEVASYASSGYCVPLPILEDTEYFNVVASTIPLIDKGEFNEEEDESSGSSHSLSKIKISKTYKKLKSRNSNDLPNKASSINFDPADTKDVEVIKDREGWTQEKESIPHRVEQQETQEGKAFEECTLPSTTTYDISTLKNQNDSTKKESINMMDYGHLSHDQRHIRGGCLSSKDTCVPRKKLDGVEQEDSSYTSNGYCVPLSNLELSSWI
jgi:hypothetical protein